MAENLRGGGRVTWVGHATVRVEIDGTAVLTDPALRRRMGHLLRRAPLAPGVAENLDAVLVSHAHLDHLDLPSLRGVGTRPLVVVPKGLGSLLRRRGLGNVTEVAPGDEIRIGQLTVLATPAEHDGRRGTGLRGPALGFVLGGTVCLYFAGDTGLFPGMAQLSTLDLALLPVWGWGPRLGPGHLDPVGAAEALTLLRPRIAVPIHWGTYCPLWYLRPPAYLSEPGSAFAREAARLAPEVEVRVLTPGESMMVSA